MFLDSSIKAVRKPNSNFLAEKYGNQHRRNISAVTPVKHSLLPQENMFRHSVHDSVVSELGNLGELINPEEGKQKLQQLQVQIKARLNNLKDLFDREEKAMAGMTGK
jgi:hypothetical protein